MMQQKQLSSHASFKVAQGMLSGLAYIHDTGLMHERVDLDNLFIDLGEVSSVECVERIGPTLVD